MVSSVGSAGSIVAFTLVVLMMLAIVLYFAYKYEPPVVQARIARGCAGASPPTDLKAVSFQLQNIQLTWTNSSNAVKYKIFVSSIPGVTESTAFQDYVTTDNKIVISNLVVGRTYYMRIKSVNACGDSGVFSEEVSARLGFPEVFRIVSRDQPDLGLTVAPNFEDIIAAPFCSGNPGDTNCLWVYNELNGHITSVDSPNVCMRTYHSVFSNILSYAPCTTLAFSYNPPHGTWNYTPGDGSLCNNPTVDGISCIKLDVDNETVIKANYDGSKVMQWDIVGV